MRDNLCDTPVESLIIITHSKGFKLVLKHSDFDARTAFIIIKSYFENKNLIIDKINRVYITRGDASFYRDWKRESSFNFLDFSLYWNEIPKDNNGDSHYDAEKDNTNFVLDFILDKYVLDSDWVSKSKNLYPKKPILNKETLSYIYKGELEVFDILNKRFT